MGHYTLKDGKWVDKKTGEPVDLPSKAETWSHGSSAMIGTDYKGYTCPVTNKWIEGKAAHQENLKRHNCRVLEKGEKEQNAKTREREFDRECRAVARALAAKAAERYDSITTR